MYFNPWVKEKKEDFFDYEVLQGELRNALENKMMPFIAVYGLRRTGKTSLIRVVLNTLKKKYVWIDGREVLSREDFGEKLYQEIGKLKRFRIAKLSFKEVELSLGFLKEGFEYLHQHRRVLVIDEAQFLKPLHLDRILASVFDNYPGIKVVLSGSEIGRLQNFLGKGNAKAPLYGRAIYELQTARLDKEQGYLFLKEGAQQAKISLHHEEIVEAITHLDGIIGWLTKYGWYRLNLTHPEALRKTLDEGKQVVREEFLKFASRSEGRYRKILKALKRGGAWNEIRDQVGISGKQLYSMLKRLISYGFVEKKGNLYGIADPLLELAL